MNSPFIKICGISRLEDALVAAESGATAIGFNFYSRSKRYVTPRIAAKISTQLSNSVKRVGVFVNAGRNEIEAIRNEVPLDMLQFHGDEMPEAINGYTIPVIKAVRITTAPFDVLARYSVDAFLLDSFSPEEFGGTGKIFDWNIARQATSFGNIILAGGLTPENIEEAISSAHPFGVDVSSGVEISPGIKDHEKVKLFVQRARKEFEALKNLKKAAFHQ